MSWVFYTSIAQSVECLSACLVSRCEQWYNRSQVWAPNNTCSQIRGRDWFGYQAILLNLSASRHWWGLKPGSIMLPLTMLDRADAVRTELECFLVSLLRFRLQWCQRRCRCRFCARPQCEPGVLHLKLIVNRKMKREMRCLRRSNISYGKGAAHSIHRRNTHAADTNHHR